MSKFCLFQNVKLISDKYSNENLHKGSVGTILEIWDDKNYEVEFCYENGETHGMNFGNGIGQVLEKL